MTETNETPANITEQATAQLDAKIAAFEATKPEALTTYKEFWAAAKHINELLRSSKFLDVEVLAAYRQRIDAVCEKVKDVQEEKGKTMDRVSQVKRNVIEQKINAAKELIHTDNLKAQNLLKEALAFIKDEWGNALTALNLKPEEAAVRMSKDDHDSCWLLWKQVNEDSFVRYKEVKQNNYISISNELYALGEVVEHGEPFDAIEGIKEFQKKLKGLVLEKTDWDEVRDTLNKYWERADQKFKTNKSQRNSTRINRRKEQDKRHEQWIVRQEANIQKFNDLISKNFDVITRIEQHIEKLEGDKAASRSDIFKAKVEGWIKEQQDKINDIQRANRELNEKIGDIEKRIEEGEDGKGAEETKPVAEAKKEKPKAEPKSEAPKVEEPKAEVTQAEEPKGETPVPGEEEEKEENEESKDDSN